MTHASQRTGVVRSRVSKSPVLLEMAPMSQCPMLGSPDCVLTLCSEPTEGARQAPRCDLALNRASTPSFPTFPGATSHPKTPILTPGWGL